MTNLPRIAITMGDPAGIGPEICMRAASMPEVLEICRPVIYGDIHVLNTTAQQLGMDLDSTCFQETSNSLVPIEIGVVQAIGGLLAAEAIFHAINDAVEGAVQAVVTAPINKKALSAAGYSYAGHTELFADRTGTTSFGMMLVSGTIRVVHVSTHVSLLEAIRRVKAARVLECILLAERGCRELGIASPHVAVAGLNPHAGEDSLFGTEDRDEILPAILRAQETGINVSGPYPPDTVFYRASQGEFDAVVAMYHDQGHIPIKLHGFDTGINITLGLPIVRVSVDHGTAFDIAGRGIARPNSMVQAIRTAVDLARARGEKE